MDREHLQPAGVFESQPLGFTQVVASPPGTTLFVSGQVAWDESLQLVGGADLAAQTEKALDNLRRSLAAAGASPSHVTMLRIFVVDYEPAHAGILGPRIAAFLGPGPPPASTLVGVQSLVAPGLLIEIDAVAVVPA